MQRIENCIHTMDASGTRLLFALARPGAADLRVGALLVELFVRRPTRALERILEATLGTLLTWQQRAIDRRILAEMDIRQLQDVGLCRDDVRAEIDKPFWLG